MISDQIEILHHGGDDEVTGSCHELRLPDGRGVLIDCGLFQGRDAGQEPEVDFPVDHIEALILTHVHLDHVGRLPYLLAAGFNGPIYCTLPSARLLPLVLEDAVKVGMTRNQRLIDKLLRHVGRMIVPVAYKTWQTVSSLKSPTTRHSEWSFKFHPAGHILGSAFVECRTRLLDQPDGERRVVFSGDLGAPYAPLLPAPRSPYRADILVLESTYGDRLHEGRKERRNTLQKLIERCLRNRGAVLIPAFALGRTQELLYEIEEVIHRNRRRFAAKNLPWPELDIVLDSPLGSRFTAASRELQPFWDAEARRRLSSGRRPLNFDQLKVVEGHREHLSLVDQLRQTAKPCIVLAASGMCSGGRIVHYLKALLPDPRHDVLFVGYQAQGTPGRDIQRFGPGGGYVVLDGKRVDIRAGVHTISGYSAHADQKNLVDFVRRMRKRPAQIRLVHGESTSRETLRNILQQQFPDIDVISTYTKGSA